MPHFVAFFFDAVYDNITFISLQTIFDLTFIELKTRRKV